MGAKNMIVINENGDQEMIVGSYRLRIIKRLCIGAASCVAISESVFRINEHNIAEFIASGTDDPTTLLLAAQACPTKAIVVEDVASGEQLWPKLSE